MKYYEPCYLFRFLKKNYVSFCPTFLQEPVATPLPLQPNVLAVGESYLYLKSNGTYGLSRSSESLSNEDKWFSSCLKLAVHRLRRFVLPSKYKLSPYMVPHSKKQVSRKEADVYDVVLRMADSKHSE